METYNGYVRTPADAIKLFEACRLGILPRVQRRLSEKERQLIKSGSVFVWDEREAGMRRWTDGKSWSASRVSGSFLTYREMEGKRGGGGASKRTTHSTPDGARTSDEDQDCEPECYRYKTDGLTKQSFSIQTSQSQRLHLISYYSRPPHGAPELLQPTTDPALSHITPMPGIYPESSLHDSNQPVLTRAPMAAYNHSLAHREQGAYWTQAQSSPYQETGSYWSSPTLRESSIPSPDTPTPPHNAYEQGQSSRSYSYSQPPKVSSYPPPPVHRQQYERLPPPPALPYRQTAQEYSVSAPAPAYAHAHAPAPAPTHAYAHAHALAHALAPAPTPTPIPISIPIPIPAHVPAHVHAHVPAHVPAPVPIPAPSSPLAALPQLQAQAAQAMLARPKPAQRYEQTRYTVTTSPGGLATPRASNSPPQPVDSYVYPYQPSPPMTQRVPTLLHPYPSNSVEPNSAIAAASNGSFLDGAQVLSNRAIRSLDRKLAL